MKKLKIVLVGILGVIFIFCLELGCKKKKGVTPPNTEPTWHEIESPTTRDLYSVFALSEDKAWAVGDSGVIIHWDGSEWSLVESPTIMKLNGVHFVDANNGWVVGDSGTILHWNGSTWAEVASPVNVNLNDVCFVSQSDGWAVGDSGVILHYNGQNWIIDYQSGDNRILTLYFLSSTDGWVTLDYYGGVLHYQNGDWVVYEPPFDIIGYSVHFTDNSNGWMVGEACIDCEFGRGWVYRYDGTKWELEELPESTKQNYWLAVFFVDENEGWVAGADAEMAHVDSAESMLHHSEKGWFVINIPNYRTVYSLYLIDVQSGWAVGENGYILELSE